MNNQLICPQCKIPHLTLPCDNFCSWYCAFWDFHIQDKKGDDDLKKWSRLNMLMKEEAERLEATNREKLSLKQFKKMEKENKTIKPLMEMQFTSSDEKTLYTTRLYATFDYCTCAGFKHKGSCKHLTKLKENYKLFN